MQSGAFLISVALMAVIAGAFLVTVRTAGRGTGARTETWRYGLIAGLTIAGVVVTVATLRPWPHAVVAQPVATVNVSAGQWYWEIEPDSVPVGQPVAFNVQTVDVTHGFAVVDPDGRILFQTQVIPGYVVRVDHTFERPGIHRIICLEYCGLGHHEMAGELTILAQ